MKKLFVLLTLAAGFCLPALAQNAYSTYDGVTYVQIAAQTNIFGSVTNIEGGTSIVGLDGIATVVFACYNHTGTNPSQTCQLLASGDSGTTWTNVGTAFTAFTTNGNTATSIQTLRLDLRSVAPLLKVTNTVSGTTVTNIYSVTLVAPKKYKS